jgi:hypothetical protein
VGEIGATKEVQAEIKGVLKGLMVKAMPSADLAAFNSATERMALTQDINRIYRGGGSEGTGRAAGYLDPSKIVTEAGTGPRNSAVDDAARLIKKFQVENFAESKFTPSLGGVGKEIMNQGGKLIHQFDPVAVRADSITRRLADALRAGVRTPMNLYDPTRYAAPPGDNNAP